MSVADIPDSPFFAIPESVCRNFDRSSRLEWLDTNHTGAFAMGTVAGVNTRRYHGLLIASGAPPADRFSVLPRVEETVEAGGKTFQFATVQYPGTVHPRGFELLEGFRIAPFPSWRYRLDNNILQKTVCVLNGQQSVLIRYESDDNCTLRVRLFLAYRDYHALTHRNSALLGKAQQSSGSISFEPYPEMPPLTIFHSSASWNGDGIWCLNNEYLRELERGLDFREDLFSPGYFSFELNASSPAWLLATLEPGRFQAPLSISDIDSITAAERARRERALPMKQPALVRALDQFRFHRAGGTPSLIAGYPWFTDWTRDTLISLPAFAALGFPASEPKEILRVLAATRRRGLLPNRFADRASTPEYNSVDAALWFFTAAYRVIDTAADIQFLRTVLYPAAQDIIEWYGAGTDYGIRVDPSDHLLSAGTPETQLTWMDAVVNGRPVTPRNGKRVEINALWYNALRITANWAGILNDTKQQAAYEAEADAARISFEAKFWNAARQCLFDGLTPAGPDASVRPNQLFAISLPFPLLATERERAVVDLVRSTLLTPVGLRTLEPGDPAYRSRFQGPPTERDSAYHQGTVWPWLFGPFVSAYLYAYGESEEAVSFCRGLVANFMPELSACCLGSISEIYDADPPHRPGGCPAQLWSVAQVALSIDRLKI